MAMALTLESRAPSHDIAEPVLLPQTLCRTLSHTYNKHYYYYYYYYYTRLTAFFQQQPGWVSRYQKGKTRLDLNTARDDGVVGWQWHQLDHMCTGSTF